MNERIQELADKTWRITSKSASDEFCEKFAELIVRQCAKRSAELGQPEIGLGILKHFGVDDD